MQFTCPNCGKPTEINPAAMLGSNTSKRKANASRRNGRLGGWPKGRKRGKRVVETGATLSSGAHHL